MKRERLIIFVLIISITALTVAIFRLNSFSFSSLAPSISINAQSASLWTIFLTGLFVGGLTCLAVQGGLLATTIAQREEEKLKKKTETSGSVLPIASFLTAKLAAYTILGFLLGSLGSVAQLTVTAQALLQLSVAIFMIGVALNLLNIHPIFRYFIIQPPRFLTRLIRRRSKSSSIFTPSILGAFTVFIPCGVTQAMMALAIASGSPIMGASILFVFVLGTSPLFFLLGFITTKLGDVFQKRFLKVASVAIILLALYNAEGALALLGSPVTLSSAFTQNKDQINSPAVQEADITINSGGYSPSAITVKSGSDVTLKLNNTTGNNCAQAFTIPTLNIQKIVRVGTSDVVKFKAPDKKGEFAFMCSMGMYRGVIHVI